MGDALDGMSDAPARPVSLSAFFMGQLEVTKAEWDSVGTWAASHGYTDLAVGAGKSADHPVQGVSWWDVIKWCNALSEKEELTPCYMVSGSVMRTGAAQPTVNWTTNGYRLPTEAEWEKSARGRLNGKRFPWDDTISHASANFNNNGGESYQSGTTGYHPAYATGTLPYTAPVGSFNTNGYGLRGMAGNVREWCWDWYGTETFSQRTDPYGPAMGEARVVRGGSWDTPASEGRVAYRGHKPPQDTSEDIGFRVVRSSMLIGSSVALTADVMINTRDVVVLTTAAEHGTVIGAGDYTPGSTAILTATAAPGYAFTAWSGDADGAINPLPLLMDQPKSVTAIFGPDNSDEDTDGLSAYLEVVVYHSDPLLKDTDGDGFDDLFEVNTGFAPASGTSTPDALSSIRTAIEFRFNAANGVSYRIEGSVDLSEWITVEPVVIGEGGVVTRFYSIENRPQRYFRVRRN
jgi:formylglycine-generating enzyme required for sulfatase activity